MQPRKDEDTNHKGHEGHKERKVSSNNRMSFSVISVVNLDGKCNHESTKTRDITEAMK